MIQTNGPIYSGFINKQDENRTPVYDLESRNCIQETVGALLSNSTSPDKPGMLLGKVQSGKTRTFIGVIALAFDNGFDVAVVFTKGTNALAKQTLARMNKDFRAEIERDMIHVFDVMSLPDPLAEYELQHKLIFVCKKEDDNIRRLDVAFFETNPDLSTKRILMIDDEADFASIGFRRTRAEGIKINKIASQLDALRGKLKNVDVLQVTATPYSLYLQPETMTIPTTQKTFLPVKPAFTQLVPIHDKYIGGDYYFEESLETDTVASYLHVPVTPGELAVLRTENQSHVRLGEAFRLCEALTSPAIDSLRRAVVAFIVGGYMRRWQEESAGKLPPKFSFIVHTETKKGAHEWQERIVEQIIACMKVGVKTGDKVIRALVETAHSDLSASIKILKGSVPTVDQIVTALVQVLPMVNYTRVNSEKDVLSIAG